MTAGVPGKRARTHRRLIRWVLGLDLFFTAGTLLFVYSWGPLAARGPALQTFANFWLVQLHLGAENVVAAWYSSMLLLAVALAACLAFAVERKQKPSPRGYRSYAWLVLAAVFTLLSLDEIGSFHERLGWLPWTNHWVVAVVQLGVATAILAGVLAHVRRVGGDKVQRFRVRSRARAAIGIGGALMTIAAAATHHYAAQLPQGDTGMPENWFPAAVFLVIARRSLAKRRKWRHRRRAAPIAALALILSAYFGAGLYGYSEWLGVIGWPHVAVIATGAAALWLWLSV